MISKFILGIVVAVFLSVMPPTQFAHACDCDIPKDAVEGMNKSDVVFKGKVRAVKNTDIQNEPYQAVLLDVEQIWKGTDESQIVIYTPSTSCQFSFVEGEQYLLYAHAANGRYTVSNCGRSSKAAHAADDFAKLGQGNEPTTLTDMSNEFSSRESNGNYLFKATTTTAVILIVLIVLIATFVILRTISKKRR